VNAARPLANKADTARIRSEVDMAVPSKVGVQVCSVIQP
jgi:hypothetical protein